MAEVSATIAGLEALKGRVSEATRQSVADALHLFQASGMGHAPVGVSGNSTNAPGDLRRSILVDGPVPVSEGTWTGEVGPTTVYGRQRELGGPIFPKSASMLRFTKFRTVYYRTAVYQHPEPYMLPAYHEVLPSLPAVVDGNIAAVLGG